MGLFSDIERTVTDGRSVGEAVWAVLDRSPRPEFSRVRTVLEEWFGAYPRAEREQLRRRLKSRRDHNFNSAFFELYLHAFLMREGFEVEVPRSTRKCKTIYDFTVRREGELAFKLEAKCVEPEKEHSSQDRYFRQVHNALQDVDSPSLAFGLTVEGQFAVQPPYRKIAREFGSWLRESTSSVVALLKEGRGHSKLPFFQTEEAGALLRATPIYLRSPDCESNNSIVIWFPVLRWPQTDRKLRKGLKNKASKYGKMSVPYVVAASVGEICDDVGIQNALLGDEGFMFGGGPAGPQTGAVAYRERNGFWWGPDGAQNTRVSAVFIVSELFPWSVSAQEPVVYHNPWAQNPLPIETLRFTQKVADPVSGKFMTREGISVSELFGLPKGWPRTDAAMDQGHGE